MASKNRQNIKYIISCLIVGIILFLALSKRQPIAVTSGTHIIMGTTVRVTVVAYDESKAREAINHAIKSMQHTEAKMSYYNEDSELSMLNKTAFEHPVKISEELFNLIKKSIEVNKISDGAFDCTISPVLELWKHASETGIRPTSTEIQEAKNKTGTQNLILNEQELTIKFKIEGMRIDLGGIAKGYAIDKAIDKLKELNMQGALVDAGGDIRCFGTPPQGKDRWKIGLQNPELAEGEDVIMQLSLNDMAITTSGDYYRFFMIGSEKINHIIDPKTSSSAKELHSVSIIAKDATTADALATAVTVLGKDKGKTMIEEMPDIEALMITSQDEIIKTAG